MMHGMPYNVLNPSQLKINENDKMFPHYYSNTFSASSRLIFCISMTAVARSIFFPGFGNGCRLVTVADLPLVI